jgi:uroporphyrin-3 C-methyltransferase
MTESTHAAEISSNGNASAKLTKKAAQAKYFPWRAIRLWLKRFVLFFCLLSIVGMGCWLTYRLWVLQQHLLAKEQRLQTALTITQTQLQSVNSAVTNLQNLTNQQQIELNHYQTELNQLLQHNSYSREDWVLTEVGYLLRLAQLNLNFFHDNAATKVLLQTADHNIQTLNDANLNNLRQALANDMVNLDAHHLDLEGLLTRLQALSSQINQLPLISPHIVTQTITPLDKHSKDWRQALKYSLESLQKLIIIRRTEQTLSPLLAPEQRFYLEQNLNIMLNKAEYALLKKQVSLYHAYVQQIAQWVQRYYSTNATSTLSVLSTLNELQQVDINTATQDINTSIAAYNQVMKQRSKPMLTELNNTVSHEQGQP